MHIRVLRNLGQGLPAFKEGQVVDADEATAEQLLGAGLAERIDKKRKVAFVTPAEEDQTPPAPPKPPSGRPPAGDK